MVDSDVLVLVETSVSKKKGLSFLGGKKTVSSTGYDMTLYLCRSNPGEERVFSCVNNRETDLANLPKGHRLYHVSNVPCCCTLTYPKISTVQGHSWDFTLEGRLRVSEGERLLLAMADTYARPDKPLTVAMTAAWLAEQAKTFVSDVVEKYGVEELKNQDLCPNDWWGDELSSIFEKYGVHLSVDRKAWESASADAAHAEAARRKQLEGIRKQRGEERQSELQGLRAQQDYEKEKEKIREDSTLSQASKEHQVHLLKINRKKEKVTAERDLRRSILRAEREVKEHELRMSQISQDTNDRKNAPHCSCCKRSLGIGEKLDVFLNLCSVCSAEYREEEADREEIAPLCLHLYKEDYYKSIFIFSRRTLQWGRGRRSQISRSTHSDGMKYTPRENNIVLRVAKKEESGGMSFSRERTLSISAVHGALTVHPSGRKERLKTIDFSQVGSWRNGHLLRRNRWETCSDKSCITIGGSTQSDIPGIGLGIHAIRNLEDQKNIQAVQIDRNDYLGEQGHRYIMVIREAAIGRGINAPLSFGDSVDGEINLWGKICIENDGFVYLPGPEAAFTTGEEQEENTLVLRPGIIMKYGAFRIEVSEVDERDFYETIQ